MTEKEKKITTPDRLSWGKYTYKYGKERSNEFMNCFTDIDDTDDLLTSWGSLAIQRSDGMEMHRDDIKKIREDFFNDISEWLPYLLEEDAIFSVYKNKKLYFWITESRMDPIITEEDFIKFIQDSFECLGYDDGELIKRNIGFDLIYPDYEFALMCIIDNNYWEKHEKCRVIKKEELINICKKTSKYKNRRIILNDVEIPEELVEYAKNKNIKIQDVKDVIQETVMLISEMYDAIADDCEIPESIYDNYR